VKIAVDRDLCQGHAVCQSEAPEVFAVEDKGQVQLLDENPPDALRASVEMAVTYCPTHALRIVED
jgi:sterol 14-demethylase